MRIFDGVKQCTRCVVPQALSSRSETQKQNALVSRPTDSHTSPEIIPSPAIRALLVSRKSQFVALGPIDSVTLLETHVQDSCGEHRVFPSLRGALCELPNTYVCPLNFNMTCPPSLVQG